MCNQCIYDVTGNGDARVKYPKGVVEFRTMNSTSITFLTTGGQQVQFIKTENAFIVRVGEEDKLIVHRQHALLEDIAAMFTF